MAVFKRVVCGKCKRELARVSKEPDTLSGYSCPCGGMVRVSSKWGVMLYLNGCNGEKVRHFKMVGTKKEAELYERTMLSDNDAGEKFQKKKDWTLSAFAPEFDGWISQRVLEGKLASGSALSYRRRMSVHIVPYFGSYDIRHIDVAVVDKYKLKRMKQVAPATVNRELATLKRCLAIAVKKGWLRANPLQGYELLNEDNESDRYLSSDEIVRLLTECRSKVAPEHLYPIVMVALNTGLRIDGVLGMKWDDVIWEQREIHRIVKGKKLVRIPITQDLYPVLRSWQSRDGVTRISGWMFPSTKVTGRPMLITSNFGLASACERAKIADCTFHTLRHTFATHVLEQHPDQINTLMTIMGHSSSYMTRRYAHITDRARHSVMASLTITGVTKGVTNANT